MKGGRSDIVGVEEQLHDAKLHQFVNSKIQRPVEFSYLPFCTDGGGDIRIIEILVHERPIYLRKEFGGLHANTRLQEGRQQHGGCYTSRGRTNG